MILVPRGCFSTQQLKKSITYLILSCQGGFLKSLLCVLFSCSLPTIVSLTLLPVLEVVNCHTDIVIQKAKAANISSFCNHTYTFMLSQ